MTEPPTVVTIFKDMDADERVRESIEKRCEHLRTEFQELARVEVTCEQNGNGYNVHAHATGNERSLKCGSFVNRSRISAAWRRASGPGSGQARG